MADDDGFITLPPGIGDSGNRRGPRPQPTVRPERDEIVFVPAPVHAPPAQPQETQPMPSIPVFTPTPAAPPATTPPTITPPPASQVDGETHFRDVARRWRLGIPGHSAPVTVDAPLFLGRNPTATVPGANVLAVDDTAKSLSKTHALVEVDGGVLYVSDLDSTNGVWVVPADGEAVEVVPGQRTVLPAGADLELGDVVIRVTHG